jgi:processing peptidase subunit alpha
MYSRLYTSVLNKHHNVDFCAAFHHCYSDSGLFGLSIAVTHEYAPRAAAIIGAQLASLTQPGSVNEREIARARNQLKSSLVMALESRAVQVEDLGRQVQVHGRKVPAEEMCEKVDRVDLAALTEVARKVLWRSAPSIVAQGQVGGLGDVKGTLRSYGLGMAA